MRTLTEYMGNIFNSTVKPNVKEFRRSKHTHTQRFFNAWRQWVRHSLSAFMTFTHSARMEWSIVDDLVANVVSRLLPLDVWSISPCRWLDAMEFSSMNILVGTIDIHVHARTHLLSVCVCVCTLLVGTQISYFNDNFPSGCTTVQYGIIVCAVNFNTSRLTADWIDITMAFNSLRFFFEIKIMRLRSQMTNRAFHEKNEKKIFGCSKNSTIWRHISSSVRFNYFFFFAVNPWGVGEERGWFSLLTQSASSDIETNNSRTIFIIHIALFARTRLYVCVRVRFGERRRRWWILSFVSESRAMGIDKKQWKLDSRCRLFCSFIYYRTFVITWQLAVIWLGDMACARRIEWFSTNARRLVVAATKFTFRFVCCVRNCFFFSPSFCCINESKIQKYSPSFQSVFGWMRSALVWDMWHKFGWMTMTTTAATTKEDIDINAIYRVACLSPFSISQRIHFSSSIVFSFVFHFNLHALAVVARLRSLASAFDFFVGCTEQ